MRRRHARLVLVSLGLTALATPLVVASFVGPARAGFVFDAVAAADGVDTTVANPSIPVGLVVQGSGPSTQARLSSLPTSDAFASFPYPGEVVAGLPGVAGSLTGAPIPPYPFIISTGLGDEPRRQTAPGLDLRASSQRRVAESAATVVSSTSGLESDTKVTADPDDGVTAVAETNVRALELLGAVKIFGLRSTATVSRDPSGNIKRDAHLSIASLVVPGLAIPVPSTVPIFGGQIVTGPVIGFTDGNFVLALPFAGAPQHIPVPAQSVLDAFGAAGVVAHYQRPVKTKDGIVGASLDLTTDLPAPPSNPEYNGPTHVTYSLGRVSASVSLTPGTDLSSRGTTPITGGGLPAVGADTATQNPSTSGGQPSGPAGLTATGGSGPLPGSNPSPSLAGASFTHRVPVVGHLADIYLLLAVMAGLGFASVHAIRLLGVRRL